MFFKDACLGGSQEALGTKDKSIQKHMQKQSKA